MKRWIDWIGPRCRAGHGIMVLGFALAGVAFILGGSSSIPAARFAVSVAREGDGDSPLLASVASSPGPSGVVSVPRELRRTFDIRPDRTDRPASVHLGQIRPGDPALFSLHFENSTPEPFSAVVSQVSCGCLSLDFEAETVDAGDTLVCRGAIDTARRPPGLVFQSGLCSFAKSGRHVSSVPLQVSALVQGAWAVPGSLLLSESSGGKVVFSVFLAGPGQFEDLSVSGVPEEVSITPIGVISTAGVATAEPAVKETVRVRQYALSVRADGPEPLRPFIASVRVPGAARHVVEVPVNVQSEAEVLSEPKRAVLTDVPVGETASMSFTLRQRADRPRITWNDLVATLPIDGARVDFKPPAEASDLAGLEVSFPVTRPIEQTSLVIRCDSRRLCSIPIVVISRAGGVR